MHQIAAIWCLPKKGTNDYRSGFASGDLISNNIACCHKDNRSYDPTYLGNVFEKIDIALSKGIPLRIFKKGDGFVYPSYDFNKKMYQYHQLRNKAFCDDFMNKACDFNNGFPKKGRDGVASFDVEKIVLFGSYVTGKQTTDSDIDLFVLLNTRKKGSERYAMVSEVLEPRKIPMDLIVKTPAEIRKRKNYFDPFIRNIEMNGKVLYEKKAWR